MADIIITIPDPAVPRVLDAFAATFHYDPENPAHGTRAQFAKAQLARWVKGVVVKHEATQARETAIAAADAQITVT